MARVGLYWILGKEKCTQHLNHGGGVGVGGERRDVLGQETSTQHFNHAGLCGLVGKGGICCRQQRHAWQTVEYVAPRHQRHAWQIIECVAPRFCSASVNTI
jgi:hypothetical protein